MFGVSGARSNAQLGYSSQVLFVAFSFVGDISLGDRQASKRARASEGWLLDRLICLLVV